MEHFKNTWSEKMDDHEKIFKINYFGEEKDIDAIIIKGALLDGCAVFDDDELEVVEVDIEDKAEDGIYLTKKKRKLTGKRLKTFFRFWDLFAYKSGKAEAADAWFDIPKLTNKIVLEIYDAAHKEAQRRSVVLENGGSPKMAQGWLTGRRWEDEIYKKMPSHYQPTDLSLKDIKKLEE